MLLFALLPSLAASQSSCPSWCSRWTCDISRCSSCRTCARPPPLPRAPSPPPSPGPPGSGTCENTCIYAGDGDCDDGGEGSAYNLCTACTDCDDCGPRADCAFSISPPPPPPPCTAWQKMQEKYPFCDPPSSHTQWSIDLESEFGPSCQRTDIGGEFCCFAPLGWGGGAPYGSPCARVCGSHGRSGSDDDYCSRSDHSHYGSCFCGPLKFPSPPHPPPPPPIHGWRFPPPPGPPGSGTCVNTCTFASDGDCDDGGAGSAYNRCTACTDCQDCGPRSHCDFAVSPPPPPPGEVCEIWKTLHQRQPYCDPPGRGTYAVDLAIELGPICGLAGEDVDGCCYMPLGYGGGPAFGSSCRAACARARRIGSDDAFCQRSDRSSYGNCFCGAVTM